jgi:hypothetical protein
MLQIPKHCQGWQFLILWHFRLYARSVKSNLLAREHAHMQFSNDPGRKFQPKYTRPLVVHKLVSDHIVKLRNPSTGKLFRNDVHLDRLKIAYVVLQHNHGNRPALFAFLNVRR